MFDAEHLYAPECILATFRKSNFPSETSDKLISDCPFSLLHFIAGFGLPLTEHWKEAAFPSLTVSFAGEIAVAGAAIDSPGSPFDPGMPAVPVSPFCPFCPFSPLGPDGPMIPCFPLFHGDPMMPLSPLFPVRPFSPLRPRTPFSPLGPGGPGLGDLSNIGRCLFDKVSVITADQFSISHLVFVCFPFRSWLNKCDAYSGGFYCPEILKRNSDMIKQRKTALR